MAQSSEFPQFTWVTPRSWSSGRPQGSVRWISIHTTEGSEGPRSAEDGAAYDQRRTDGTSAHFYVDSNSVIQCVKTTDRAHTAAYHGNLWGVHIEVCGRAGQSAAQWDDEVSRATIEQLARLCRALRVKYPVPLVNLTPTQVKAGVQGFCEHKDISQAWGETDHWDPGPRFPWARLFALIQGDEGEDMAISDADAVKVAQAVLNAKIGRSDRTVGLALEFLVGALKSTDDDVNEAAIVAGVLAGLNPQAVATAVVAALPADQARQTADLVVSMISEKLSAEGQS